MIPVENIRQSIPHLLTSLDMPELGQKHSGKVRDYYTYKGRRILITTDRISAFDVNLGAVPYKGAILNELAAWWFRQTEHIIPNHLIHVPDPNVTIAHECEPIPIEMVVRGFLTGVTTTSVWYEYQKGTRRIQGIDFPDGLNKNDQLPQPVITPTTHGGGTNSHDERLTREEILESGKVEKRIYEQMEETALELFHFGTRRCREHGLILVDTKYEFGLHNGQLMLMDEIHTPDSSRFWQAMSYEERKRRGEEPENYDKEVLRLQYAAQGYTGEGTPPPLSESLQIALALRYMSVYEQTIGSRFQSFEYPIQDRIRQNLRKIVQ